MEAVVDRGVAPGCAIPGWEVPGWVFCSVAVPEPGVLCARAGRPTIDDNNIAPNRAVAFEKSFNLFITSHFWYLWQVEQSG